MQRRISSGNSFCALRQVDLGCDVFVYWIRLFTDNVLTNSKVKIARTVTGRSVYFVLFFGETSDGTRAQIACPTAAAGSGVGAERTWSDGATSQSRGEE